MPPNTRSHSPPLPPNATYNHPVIALNILPSAKLFVAGSKLTGILEVSCKERNSVALGQLAIEFIGVEELKLLDHSAQASVHGPHRCIFQGPSLPPSNAVATSEAPIGGHYYTALRGRTKFPFAFPLPSKLPPSTHFGSKARVCYTLKATCQVLSIQSRQNVLVTKSKLIQIVERMLDWNDSKYYEAVEMRGELREPGGSGAGVWAEVKIDKRLHWHQLPTGADQGLIRAQLTVKNTSRRTLSGGVNAKICRALVLPDDKSHDPIVEIVRNCSFRGPEYEFPSIPGQAKTVNLICQLPNPFQDEGEGSQDADPFCFSAKGMKLFSVNMFLRVELELGALSNDLVIDLPIYIAHPSSLPREATLKNTPLTIEHVPSPNPMSIHHLTQPSSSGRASRNRPRSTSPHPPSLQPGGSRCSSPQPSLSIGSMGDWGGYRSAAPSPIPSPHFSPLPSPCHSPLPTPRFSLPTPFSPSPAANLHHHPPAPAQVTAPMYHPPTPNWSNAMAPYGADHLSMGQDPQTDSGYHHPPPPGPQVLPLYPQQRPATVQPAHDPYSTAGPSMPQYHTQPNPNPVFSPPATPWRRQTVPDTSTVSDGRSYQVLDSFRTATPSFIPPTAPHYPPTLVPFPAPHSHAHPAILAQEVHGPSPFSPPDICGPTGQQWRVRHQSLPPVPVLSPYPQQQNPNEHYCGPAQQATHNPFDGHDPTHQLYQPTTTTSAAAGLIRQPSNSSSRRTSEPVIPNQAWMNGNGYQQQQHQQQQQTGGQCEARKRALPRPPMDGGEGGARHLSDAGEGVARPVSAAGEGPARFGSAFGQGGGNMVSNVNVEEPHYQEPSHVQEDDLACSSRGPTGVTAPNASRLETIGEQGESRAGTMCAKRMSQNILNRLATQSEGADDGEGAGQRRGPQRQEAVRVVSHPRGMRPRRSEGSESVQTLEDMVAMEDARREASSTSPSPSLEQTPAPARQQDQDGSESLQPKSSPARSTSRNRQGQATGLANLAQFLKRAASAELAPSSSSRAASSHHGQLGDGSGDGASVGDQATRALTPSYAGSALRLKSNQIHYDEAFVDAVPSPTAVQKPPASAESVSSKSDWKPPTHHEGPALVESSMVKRIGLCEESEEEEEEGARGVVTNRESVAPEALFPQFELEQRSSLSTVPTKTRQVPIEASSPSSVIAATVELEEARDNGSRSTTTALVIPSVSPLVKKKNSKTVTPRLGNPTKKPVSVSVSVSEDQLPSPAHESPVSKRDGKVAVVQQQQQPETTVVERLRNQNGVMNTKVTSWLKQGDDGAAVGQKEQVREAQQEVGTGCSGLGLVMAEEVAEHQVGPGCSGLGLVMAEEVHAQPAKAGRDEDVLARLLLARAAAQDSQRAKASEEHGRVGALNEKTATVVPQDLVPSSRESARANGPADLPSARATGPLAPRPIKHFDQSLLSQSVMRRPLPISGITLDRTRSRLSSEAAKVVETSSKTGYDPNTPTRALFPVRKQPQSAREESSLLAASLTKASSSRPLSVPCSDAVSRSNPTHRWSVGNGGLQLEASGGEGGLRSSSSTNLARKSRIKRQVSSTMSPPEPGPGWARGREIMGGGAEEGEVVVRQVPGGWNESESNEIEAELIKALEETNRAVQKATSKRLSTPMFAKSPSFNTSVVLARAVGQQAQAQARGRRGMGAERERVRASVSMIGNGESGVQRMYSGAVGRRVSSEAQREEDSLASEEGVDAGEETAGEAARTVGEYCKSMRGGRGGRVSSVAAKWAKLAQESNASGAEEEEGTVRWSGPTSSRGVSICEKVAGRAASNAYSITSLLGRSGSGSGSRAEVERAGSGSLEARRFGRMQDGNRGFGTLVGQGDRVGQGKMVGVAGAGHEEGTRNGGKKVSVSGIGGVSGIETSSGSSGRSSVESYGVCSTVWSSSASVSGEEGIGGLGGDGEGGNGGNWWEAEGGGGTVGVGGGIRGSGKRSVGKLGELKKRWEG